MENVEYILAILSGILTAIPLIIKLTQYIKMAVVENQWDKIMKLTMRYMEIAETLYKTGAEKKKYVMQMVEASAKEIGYEIDMQAISDMIDRMCDMSKVVNAETISA